MKLAKGDKVAIVCCSNGKSLSKKKEIENLKVILEEMSLIPVFSKYIYQKISLEEVENNLKGFPESGSPLEKARELMEFYEDASIKKQFCGYSDLTTIINAIYAKTQKVSVLYQIRNVLYEYSAQQKEDFIKTCFAKDLNNIINNDAVKMMEKNNLYDLSVENSGLYQFPYKFYQGKTVEGIVVGGNIRCFLKLAGTEYFPDVTDKILLLEARSGNTAQIVTYFAQLEQLGVFKKVKGILLGTFTQMEREQPVSAVYSLLKRYINEELPVVKTEYIGHGEDSKAIQIGKKYKF